MSEKNNNDTSLSLSKQRKLARQGEIKKMKRDALISKIVWTCITLVLIGGIGTLIGYSIYRGITKVVPDGNYSAMLTDNGFIEDVDASSLVTLCDYSTINIPNADVTYSEEELNKDIDELLSQYPILSKDTTAAIVNGDKVNIDYVGTIDGVEFENGNTKGAGSDVTVGSGGLIGNFEEQLIGHVIGDNFIVTATFPDDYQSVELASKTAQFDVTINGIYVPAEFNDTFVTTNLSKYATTAEGYRTYVRDTEKQKAIESWIEKYLLENCSVSSYPKKYIEKLKSLRKYEDVQNYEYMNQMYVQYTGQPMYKDFEAYLDKSEAKYDSELSKSVKDTAKMTLICQAIAEKEGITATPEAFKAYLIEQGQSETVYENYITQYGQPYMMKEYIGTSVLNLLKDKVSVQ